jgi:hypothetical protein
MPEVSVSHIVICLQALETAMKHYEYISKSQTVDPENFEEILYEFEKTLNQLCKIYKQEEAKGNTHLPLKDIISYDYRDR